MMTSRYPACKGYTVIISAINIKSHQADLSEPAGDFDIDLDLDLDRVDLLANGTPVRRRVPSGVSLVITPAYVQFKQSVSSFHRLVVHRGSTELHFHPLREQSLQDP